jgi:hypothetical protein
VDFKNQFKGWLCINIGNNQLYYEKDGVTYDLPEDEKECWGLISRSVQEKKNLLLELPRHKPFYQDPSLGPFERIIN